MKDRNLSQARKLSSKPAARSALIDTLESRQLLSASVTGYLPDYRSGIINKLDWSTLTAVNYFSVIPDAVSGKLPDTGPGSPAATSSGGSDLSHLTDLVTAAHAHNVKVNIVVGGADAYDDTLNTIIATPALHDAFAQSVQTFADKYDVDGVDLDWEETTTTHDQLQNYADLIHSLKTTTNGLSLSAAVLAEGVDTDWGTLKQLTPGAINDLDKVNVMDYDLEADNHSPEPRAQSDMNDWAYYVSNSRNPKNKLVYGVPFYGRGQGSSWNGTQYELSYADIVSGYKAAHNNQAPPSNATSATVGGRLYYYNAPDTIQSKTSYAVNNGFGGVMIWELGHDIYTGNAPDPTLSLMAAVKRGLGGSTPTPTPTTGSIAGRVLVGSTGLAGMQIYVDTNNDSVMQSTEPRTLSDIYGNYSFSNVAIGSDRIVRQVMRPGYAQVTPSNNYGIHVNVTADSSATGLNFTDRQTSGPTPPPTPVPEVNGTITGSVVVGASGLANVTVYADVDNDGQLDSNEVRTTTDSSGNFTLAGVLASSDRIVRQILPAGYSQVTPTNNYGLHVNLVAGQVKSGQIFTDLPPVRQSAFATINGLVFEDKNGNGKQDSGENGLSGWTVFIDGNDNGKIDPGDYTIHTTSNGSFSFTGLQSAGTYKVRMVPPTDYIQVTPGNSYGIYVTVKAGQTVGGVTFGAKKK